MTTLDKYLQLPAAYRMLHRLFCGENAATREELQEISAISKTTTDSYLRALQEIGVLAKTRYRTDGPGSERGGKPTLWMINPNISERDYERLEREAWKDER
jgi:predicted transcriptional regulator